MGSVTVMVRVLRFEVNVKETRSLHFSNDRGSRRQK